MSAYAQDARLTVGELIQQLQQRDPSTLVLVNGYEGYQAPPRRSRGRDER